MTGLLTRNFGLKLLALSLAILLWFSVAGRRRERFSERAFDVPLTIVNLPQNLVIASSLPETVNIRLRGPFTAMRAADASRMEAVLDLSDSAPGEQLYKLSPDDINAPEDLEVVALNPPAIKFTIAKWRAGAP
jgi:YbbR domain-containing protein